MLVLGRKLNESINIGNNIRVIVVGGIGSHQQVRIGIEAPLTEHILRSELADQARREQGGDLPPTDPEVPPR
jgi:carbon storage regulator CsrA